MVLLRYAALGIRRSALVRPVAIISAPAETLLAGRHSLLQQRHQQSLRLSSTDSAPSESPSSSSPTSTPNAAQAFVPQTTGPPPYDIPVLEPPWQVSNLSLEEQNAYAKYGPKYLDHVKPKRREVAFRSARRRQYIAELYSKDIGPDWYEIYEEAAKKRVIAQTGNETARSLQQLKDLDVALKKSSDDIWEDLALTHKERLEKVQSIQRQREEINDKRGKIMADKKLADRKIIGEVLVARGRTPPAWCFSSEDVLETSNKQ